MKLLKLFIISLSFSRLFASDPITIDSLFKKSNGTRVVSEFGIISNGGGSNYINYDSFLAVVDGTDPINRKDFYISETVQYEISNKLDILSSLNVSHKVREFINESGDYIEKKNSEFNSLSIGFLYTFDSINSLAPTLYMSTPVIYKLKSLDDSKKASFTFLNSKLSFKQYLDPSVLEYSIGFVKSFKEKVGKNTIEYPDALSLGLSNSITLNPKLSLGLSLEQKFQTRQKVNGIDVTGKTTQTTFGVSSTYGINAKKSITFSFDNGISSDAPESVVSISLWQKF